MEQRTRSYLRLVKPGITISNTLSAVAGVFLAASAVGFDWLAAVGVVGGVALIIASACVANNILDRDIDKKMKRTISRGVASGEISISRALLFATVLGVVGFGLLLAYTNMLTFLLGVVAYVWYVAVYGVAKRTTALSTLIGGVAGALPPVAGYTALTGHIDGAAIVLFLILFFWQLPHFYAISMFRKDDYAEVNLPVWSVKYGMKSTKRQILWSVVAYALVVPPLALFSEVGVVYLVGSSVLSLYWLYVGISTYRKATYEKWARSMFGVSLLVLLAINGLIAVGGYLP